MPEFPKLPIITPPPNSFPDLPIITPDPPRLTLREKYGSLYYLGIAGLVITIGMVGLFAFGVWATRDIWRAFYVLNDQSRPESERIKSAWVLARSNTVNDAQRMQVALTKDLPLLARYVVAEGLTSDAIRADPKGYALMVAKSEGWPDWLRLLMARPMAYGVGEGYRIAWEPLDLLREHKDPAIALWATYTRSVMAPGDPAASKALADAASTDGPFRPLAVLLEAASKADGEAQVKKLDEATVWLRTRHPGASKLWVGWEERDGQLVETSISGKTEAAP
jgi:hypothetical protein